MKRKIEYGVFTTNQSGEFYMVKGNFGNNKSAAQRWMVENGHLFEQSLYVQKVEY